MNIDESLNSNSDDLNDPDVNPNPRLTEDTPLTIDMDVKGI